MTMNITTATPEQWDEVATLIHESLNVWYLKNRGISLGGDPQDDRLFCETYAAIDSPECLLVAVDEASGRIAGSCFIHPRKTHWSLGILNVHPDFFGQGVASQILQKIVGMVRAEKLPLRLVSSAMNLDSYSLYNRFGFVPYAVYQDMQIPPFSPDVAVPETVLAELGKIRPAMEADLPKIVALEKELCFVERPAEYAHFLQNVDGIWKTFVLENENGSIDAVLSSVNHPASCMLGPGVMRTESQMLALIYTQLSQINAAPIFLVPADCRFALRTLYAWGAKNTEIHLGQCLGDFPSPVGIDMPTFLPE